ncbi:uncharacterized protein LOC126553468 isoform X1 [Aphis gossypii]|uniref:uncharacterized protein LOC126553468 isoform X1 n=1 Tax=Aphis gossypii TaxID=80765 RepID=UPI0021593969|nr:uncharacterized protein LOC126553468 isoform X1 [Aphis gossypii]
MATRKIKVSWVIVVFVDSKDYSVVPTKWLVQNDTNNLENSNVRLCKWPLGRVTSTDIHDALDPDPTWFEYGIKIVGGNKTYDNFKKAWHVRVEKESENEEVHLMTKCKRASTIFDVSSSSSDEDHSGYCIIPESTSAFKLPNNEEPVHYTELQPVNSPPLLKPCTMQPNETFPSLLSHQMSKQSSSVGQLPCVQSSSVYQPPQDEQYTSAQNTQQLYTTPNTNTYGFYEDKLDTLNNNILQGQTATNLMLNRIFAKIEVIEANLKNTSQSIVPTVYIDPIFLSYFPLKNADELLSIENLIKNETEFVLKLESFIKSIGGNCAANHIKRVMSKLFTDEYCIYISWTGRGWAKNMTKLKETELIKIVKKVIQQCSSTLFNDSQFEKEITERLRTANTRFKNQMPEIRINIF